MQTRKDRIVGYELGFLGAGNMAEAIAKAAISKGVLRADQMIASDPVEARRTLFAGMGIKVADNAEVVKSSKQVLLAVKPQVMQQAAADLAAFGPSDQVVISIMAGVTSKKLAATVAAAKAEAKLRVVRVMPNTPLMVGLGMAGICLGEFARPGDDALAQRLFGAGGAAVSVDESKMDAITAVSGSGPAYVFYLAEAMERAANELGLGQAASRKLVQQTILGAAHMLAESPDTAVELRRKVTSPGGTTEAAIRHMEGNKSIDVFVNAIKAAEKRSKELGA